jgi:hypothetical protein
MNPCDGGWGRIGRRRMQCPQCPGFVRPLIGLLTDKLYPVLVTHRSPDRVVLGLAPPPPLDPCPVSFRPFSGPHLTTRSRYVLHWLCRLPPTPVCGGGVAGSLCKSESAELCCATELNVAPKTPVTLCCVSCGRVPHDPSGWGPTQSCGQFEHARAMRDIASTSHGWRRSEVLLAPSSPPLSHRDLCFQIRHSSSYHAIVPDLPSLLL